MQQLSKALREGAEKKTTLVIGKGSVQQQKLTAGLLAQQLGMSFPQMGNPIIMEEGQPVVVHAGDLVSPDSFFLTDYAGQMVTVQPMMGG